VFAGTIARHGAQGTGRGDIRPGDRRGLRDEKKGAAEAAGNGADAIGDFLKSSSGRALTREVVRGVFGMLKRGL
jgi:hypothetical protein